MRGPSGHMSMHVCVCVRALCTCVYMCVCVCVCARAHTCMHARTCVHSRRCVCVCMCVCMRVRVRACTCEGNEDALPLGPSSPTEGQPPSCLPTLGALRGGLGGFPGLFPFMLKNN